MKNYLTIFLPAKNIHLVKDVGLIPYMFHKLFNFQSFLLCRENGRYPYLKSEVPGLKMVFLKRIFNNQTLDILYFLTRNRAKFDIIQLYHIDRNSLLIAFYIKLINPNRVKVYLKTDTSHRILDKKFNYLKYYFYKICLKRIDVASAETMRIKKYLSDKFFYDFKYVPNGFYDNEIRQNVNFKEKKNIILTVGRLGTFEKATEVLCEAFKIFAQVNNTWELNLVGPIEKNFEIYLNNFLLNCPHLKNRIKVTGEITDRESLAAYYKEAKLFVLPSRYESFGLVLLEAAKAGCFIVSTNLDSAIDITDNNKFGKIFPVDDYKSLSEILVNITFDENHLEEVCNGIQQYVYEKFYLPNLCRQLLGYLN